jgi:LEA14-like dessication related protein
MANMGCMRLRVALCAAAALLASACALAPKLQPPELSIVGVQMVGTDLFAQRLKVRLHVQNPNNRVLPVDGLEYTLEVDGQPFATGESASSFVVPALGAAEFDMNVTTNVAGTLLRLLTHGADSRGPGIPYRLYGKVTLSSGWLRSIPFEERGSFNLQ